MMSNASRSSRWRFLLTALALGGAALGIGWGVGELRKQPAAAPSSVAFSRGELLYQTGCANCHGADGRGDGVSSAALKPPPRDFAARPWRFEPTKASIRSVILTGIPGTAMPASQVNLSDVDLDLLVEHVHGLATSRPHVVYEPPLEEQRLRVAGFTDLRGITPPPLTVSNESGQATTLADLRGRLVIVHFWGTTCVHCMQGMPALSKLETEYAPRGLTVLHVCADADASKEAQALLDKHVSGVQAHTDKTGLGLARFEVQTLPTVWLIAPDGTAIGRTSGAVDWHSPGLVQLLDHWLPMPRNGVPVQPSLAAPADSGSVKMPR
jgi:mono/diheme cytochrome c family protein